MMPSDFGLPSLNRVLILAIWLDTPGADNAEPIGLDDRGRPVPCAVESLIHPVRAWISGRAG